MIVKSESFKGVMVGTSPEEAVNGVIPPVFVLAIGDEDHSRAFKTAFSAANREYVVEGVETPEALFAALERGECDLVVAEFPRRGFDAFGALRSLRAAGKRVPFIVVSRAIGSDIPIAAMRLGAADFVRPSEERDLSDSVKRVLAESGALSAESS